MTTTELIKDGQQLDGAKYSSSGTDIQTYDDGFGPLWISRNSIGIYGIVRARTWEDAYSICEDEFFPEADETVEELAKDYGFRRHHCKVIRDASVVVETEPCRVGERLAQPEDYGPEGLKPQFVRWVTITESDPEAWTENGEFLEAYGFRNNGPNERDSLKHGIYAKDLNGDSLDRLTPELLAELGITLEISDEGDGE